MTPLVEFIKSLLIPGTLTFLLAAVSVGLIVAFGPRRTRRLALPFLTAIVAWYWLGSLPVFADLLATRFHAATATPVGAERAAGAEAIVVLGAGIRTSYVAAGHTVVVPDMQTIYNAIEAGRLFHLTGDRLVVIASGGKQDGAPLEATESGILREWLMRAGVPPERILLESGSRNTREQGERVAPLLQANHWRRFLLVTPAVQGPRAAAVFRAHGVDPIVAAAPFWPEGARAQKPGWTPTGGALRVTERATYDYLAWVYYLVRGWL